MASGIHLEPPVPFDFKDPNMWPRWKRHFQQFHMASSLSEEPDEKQISTLLYCMGELAEDTLAYLTSVLADNRKKYDMVLRKFDNFFRMRKNIIFEHACFQPDEFAEQFLTTL